MTTKSSTAPSRKEIQALLDLVAKTEWDEYDQPEEVCGVMVALKWVLTGESSDALDEVIKWASFIGEDNEEEGEE